jgi:hypothetical protein
MLSSRGNAFDALTRGSRSLAWLHGGERTLAPGILWESGPLSIRAAGSIGVRSHVTGAVTVTHETADAAPVEEERRRRVEIDTTQLGWIFGAVGVVAASMAPLAEKAPGLYYLALVTGGGWAAWRWKDRADQ